MGSGRLRAFRREDIPDVVALRQQVFHFSERRSASMLAEYFERIFFHHPWPDEELHSWVHEDRRGRVTGFLGVLPRRMTWRGQPIRTAVSTQLMVEPPSRGLVGLLLVRAFLAGPQDWSVSDTANDVARRIFESVGATTSMIHSLVWLRPLRPCRDLASSLAHGLVARGALFAARPLVAAGDTFAARRGGGAARQPAGTIQPLTPALMLAPAFVSDLATLGCGFARDGPWVLIHSRRPELMPAVERGDALLSRLDGEWWLSF